MMDSAAAREVILARIRESNAHAATGNGAPSTPAADYASIERHYQWAGSLPLEERLTLFEERLREYDAGMYRATAGSIAAVVAQILGSRGKRTIAIPDGLPAVWLPAGFVFMPADRLRALDLDLLDGVLSACAVGIATTGTLVLQNASGQGPRRLSLVPDYHLCVILASQVVETVPEAFARLAATSTLPTTFISGPSATSDIEMTRIKGVHGPRFLDVVLVTEDGAGGPGP
jgi:L-lactate dehydrogenase complex protein LldG